MMSSPFAKIILKVITIGIWIAIGACGSGSGSGGPSSDALPADAVVSDVGSCKAEIVRALTEALPGATVIPAHPVAGTERSGPEAGFATLFAGVVSRNCAGSK